MFLTVRDAAKILESLGSFLHSFDPDLYSPIQEEKKLFEKNHTFLSVLLIKHAYRYQEIR